MIKPRIMFCYFFVYLAKMCYLILIINSIEGWVFVKKKG